MIQTTQLPRCLPLLGVLASAGCGDDCPPPPICPTATCPGEMEAAAWTSHEAAINALVSGPITGPPPELHDGDFGLTAPSGGGANYGTVWAKDIAGPQVHREVWLATSFSSFKNAGLMLVSKNTLQPAWPDSTIPATTGNCAPNFQGSCLADTAYNYYSLAGVSGAPTSIPAGVTPIEFKVMTEISTPCNSTTPVITETGRLYRELAVVNGQEKWFDHWVLVDPAFKTPQVCTGASSTDNQIRLKLVPDSPAPARALSAFLDGMKTGACAAVGVSGCRYAPMALNWKTY